MSIPIVVAADRWQAICERAISDAEDGDPAARSWVSEHVAAEDKLLEFVDTLKFGSGETRARDLNRGQIQRGRRASA
jgi:hypothetical protein